MVATAAHTTLLRVPILKGAAEQLVSSRQLRNKYETNRDIKTYSAWFLLKALTTSGYIKDYIKQCESLCTVLQCGVSSLRGLVHRMAQKELLTVDDKRNLTLCSYERAAEILDIVYSGVEKIEYDYAKQKGHQIFSYIIRLREIVSAKERQLDGLMYHIAKNPLLQSALLLEMNRQGASDEEVETVAGFHAWLLKLQLQSFVHGSESYNIIHARRADTNRSVKGIQKDHAYKHFSSVSYMKKVLQHYGLATVTKTVVESKVRSRHYVPDEDGVQRDGYKWNNKSLKTFLPLCDQITPLGVAGLA